MAGVPVSPGQFLRKEQHEKYWLHLGTDRLVCVLRAGLVWGIWCCVVGALALIGAAEFGDWETRSRPPGRLFFTCQVNRWPTMFANDAWTLPSLCTTVQSPPDDPDQEIDFVTHVMIKTPAAMPAAPAVSETKTQRFERILALAEFKPLKAVFDHLDGDTPAKDAAICTTCSYRLFLGKLGYRVVVVKQIHEQDCYARLGPAGGIRAVVPLHDTATYSTLVTLVNFDSTVTTTPQSVDYYDEQMAAFKVQCMNRSGNAP